MKQGSTITVMSEQDETRASERGGDAPTEIHPRATAPAEPLAYSQAEADTEEFGARSWRSAWGHAGLLMVCAGVVAMVIGVVGWVVMRSHEDPQALPPDARITPTMGVLPPSSAPAAPTNPPVAAPTPAAPSSAPNPRPLRYDARGVPMLPTDPTPEEEQQVLAADLDHVGVPYSNPAAAAIDAQSVCEWLGAGHHSGAELFAHVQRTHPSFSGGEAGKFAGASLGVYCRQFGYLLDAANSGATS